MVAGCSTSPEVIPAAASATRARTGVAANWDSPFGTQQSHWIDGATLSMSAAVSDALTQNTSLRAALMRLEAARARVDQASRLPNPMLDLFTGAPIGMGVEPWGAMIGEQLSFLWTIEQREQIATSELRAATLEVARQAVDTVFETQRLFMTAHMNLQIARANESAAASSALLFESAQMRATVGETSARSVHTSGALQAEVEMALIESQSLAQNSMLALLEFMGRADAKAPTLEPPPALPEITLSEEELLDHTMATDLSVAASIARVRTAAARAGLADASRLSNVSARVGQERNMEGDKMWMFGVSIELPIFNDGSPAIREALAELNAARIEAEGARQKSIARVRTALTQWNASVTLLEAARRGLAHLEHTSTARTDEARTGVASSIPAVEAALFFAKGTALALAAERDATLARIEVNSALGGSSRGDAWIESEVSP